MSDKRRVVETNFGLFSNGPADGGGGFLVPMNNLNVGPGEPGPEDEWQVPAEPVSAQNDVSPESDSDGAVVQPLPPTAKG
jgi:hypothetical protein